MNESFVLYSKEIKNFIREFLYKLFLGVADNCSFVIFHD